MEEKKEQTLMSIYGKIYSQQVSSLLHFHAKLRDLASGEILATFEHSDGLGSLLFTPDGTRLLSGCIDSVIRVWDLASGLVEATLQGHSSGVISSLCFVKVG